MTDEPVANFKCKDAFWAEFHTVLKANPSYFSGHRIRYEPFVSQTLLTSFYKRDSLNYYERRAVIEALGNYAYNLLQGSDFRTALIAGWSDLHEYHVVTHEANMQEDAGIKFDLTACDPHYLASIITLHSLSHSRARTISESEFYEDWVRCANPIIALVRKIDHGAVVLPPIVLEEIFTFEWIKWWIDLMNLQKTPINSNFVEYCVNNSGTVLADFGSAYGKALNRVKSDISPWRIGTWLFSQVRR